MLIDFEKDCLSWNFLYKDLESFGYGKNFIKWIKHFNKEITVYVTQCGFLSNIRRGCHKGDPIAAY